MLKKNFENVEVKKMEKQSGGWLNFVGAALLVGIPLLMKYESDRREQEAIRNSENYTKR